MSSSRLDIANLPLVAIPNAVPLAPIPASSTSTQTGVSTAKSSPVNLFDASTYADLPRFVNLSNGQVLSLPTLTAEEQQHVQSLFGNVDAAGLQRLNDSSRKLAQALLQAVTPPQSAVSMDDPDSDNDSQDDSSWSAPPQATAPQNLAASGMQLIPNSQIVYANSGLSATAPSSIATATSGLNGGSTPVQPSVSIVAPTVASNLSQAGQVYNSTTGNQNYDQTVEAVSYMGMLGLQGELTDYAKQVQANVDAQKTTRIDLADVTQALASWPAGVQTQAFSWTTYDEFGKPTRHENVQLTETEAEALKQNLQNQLTSMSDANQDMQLQLQDMTQKYQEAINTISNMLKYEHDTVKAIIQNIHS